MAFTLNQFQSALNKGTGTVAGATAATVINNAGKVNKAVDSTFAAAGKATSAIKGAMPASNKKVDAIAAKFNNRINDLEMKTRITDVKLAMVAQMTGVQFPTDEEIVEALMEQDEEDAKVAQAEAAAQVTQGVADAIANPEILNMVGMLVNKLFGVNPLAPVEETEEIVEVKAEEIVEVVAEPKKEEDVATKAEKVNKGRRKLGRQAPLAE